MNDKLKQVAVRMMLFERLIAEAGDRPKTGEWMDVQTLDASIAAFRNSNELIRRAMAGDLESAELLYVIAGHLVSHLHAVAKKHPESLVGMASSNLDFPAMVARATTKDSATIELLDKLNVGQNSLFSGNRKPGMTFDSPAKRWAFEILNALDTARQLGQILQQTGEPVIPEAVRAIALEKFGPVTWQAWWEEGKKLLPTDIHEKPEWRHVQGDGHNGPAERKKEVLKQIRGAVETLAKN